MKTCFTVVVETIDMKEVVPEEYLTGDKECPADEAMTSEIEGKLHKAIFEVVKELLQDKDALFERMIEMDDEFCVEGFDNLDDYGTIKITITEEAEPAEVKK